MEINIVIVLVIVSAITLPALILKIKANQKKKKKLEILKNYAKESGFQITDCERIEKIYLGVDKNAKMCFYINFSTNNRILVDLNSIKQCKVYEAARSANTSNGRSKIIEKVELQFLPKDNKEAKISLEFFNIENGDFQIAEELLLTRKWEGIINKIISEKSS
ncbi:MAG: hypothetical protein A2X64_01150 [Ignavibacteria bacterium GWF2_33_9]|nr:MAG: hypothetical protein A2X64_01150 [Ignavibacteria bacterium GWF2_33_9]